MSPRQLLRKPYPSLPRLGYFPRRFQSSPRLPPHKSSDTKTQARAAKVLDRVPRFLRRYTDGLRTAPVTHVVSFLILHELTAVIPLVGLASYFHYANWLPPLFSDSAYLAPGIQKFGAYFRRKGWIGLGEESSAPSAEPRVGAWDVANKGTRVVVEVAAAYAITKAILPLRLLLSVWLTPWFARVAIGRVWNGLRGLVRGKGRG